MTASLIIVPFVLSIMKNLYAAKDAAVTKNIAHPYILISTVYEGSCGIVIMANENIPHVSQPNSLRITVTPSISISINGTTDIIFAAATMLYVNPNTFAAAFMIRIPTLVIM